MAATLQVKVIIVDPHVAGGPAEPKPGISVCQCMCLPDIYFMDEKKVGKRKFYIQVLDIGRSGGEGKGICFFLRQAL